MEDKKRKAACVRNSEIKHSLGPAGKRSPGNAYWTEEKMLEYLVDCDSMSIDEVIAKWGIGKKSTAMNYRTTFKKKLHLDKKSKHLQEVAAKKPQEPEHTGTEGISLEIERITE
jgi:hypothetical protein